MVLVSLFCMTNLLFRASLLFIVSIEVAVCEIFVSTPILSFFFLIVFVLGIIGVPIFYFYMRKQ